MNINMKKGALLLTVSALLAFNSAANAAFQDPATASWGNWNRGDVNTAYAEWSVINEEGSTPTPGEGYVGFDSDSSPDVGSYNTTAKTNIYPCSSR